MVDRCEPPAEWRGVDGWHVVWRGDEPMVMFWDGYWRQRLIDMPIHSLKLAEIGFRYGSPAPKPGDSPVPAPDALAALVKAGEAVGSEFAQTHPLIIALRAALAAVKGPTT